MKVNLDPESGLRELPDDDLPIAETRMVISGPSSISQAAAQERVQDVILAALQQRLPRNRELKAWEPQKLNARHIAMCCDRASGTSAAEISKKYNIHQVYTNVILTHPDSIHVIGAIQSLNADKMTDVNARLQGYAHEMLSGKVEIFRTTADNRLKDSIATDLLDRAGYGPRQKIDLNATHRLALPSAQAMLLTAALSEDRRVATVDYSEFTGRKLSDAQTALESGAQDGFQSRSEQPTVVSASPEDSPEQLSETLELRRSA